MGRISARSAVALGWCFAWIAVSALGCATEGDAIPDGGDPSSSSGSGGAVGGTSSSGAATGGGTGSSGSGGGAEPPSGDGSGGSSGSAMGDGGGSGSSGGSGPRPAAPCATTSYGGFGLTMYECDPSGMTGKTPQPAPLVFALHGYTQGAIETPASGQPSTPAWGYMSTTQWAILAEKYKFYVVFPSTGSDSSARSFYWYQQFYVTRGGLNSDASNIASMVQTMQQNHNIDANKIFISGLSAGAGMANLMLACYPDVFAGGASFEGVAVGCDENCAALGKTPPQWTWPGNHASSLVTGCDASWWSDPNKRKPRLMVFQGDKDGAVTPENMADIVQQFAGALGISTTPTSKGTLKGAQLTTYGTGQLATVFMSGIGHGTPVQPGPPLSMPPYYVVGAQPADDEGGWDPVPSHTMVSDPNAVQDWTNTTGLWGPYEAGKFWGIIP